MFCQIYPFFCPQGSSVGRGSRGRGQGVLNRALEREQDAKISPPPPPATTVRVQGRPSEPSLQQKCFHSIDFDVGKGGSKYTSTILEEAGFYQRQWLWHRRFTSEKTRQNYERIVPKRT